ncbi:hypothetical protein E6R18_15195 [Streptomyces sp. A1277]|uniref:hypothetical protein n=1 Tax=Streptomyces sp. A1277 TaxID=2563103 RepID=UPI0010A22E20|nr:hypothetical protein [Streptomyces sp. A1277]THA31965.1 hypothetical protein E6R18_15195 [Streptomyces sp. A1277]
MNPTTPEAAVTDGEQTTDKPEHATAQETDQQDLDEAGRGAGADADAEDVDVDADADAESSGLVAAAAAVVSAGLGVAALTGGWSGRVAAERETLIGQIKTSSGGSAAQQISEIYGDAWHATALVNGLFGLLALLVGCYVLVRPAFGAPTAHPQAGWVRAVAKGGIALGTLGVLISVAMYFDLIVALPATAG